MNIGLDLDGTLISCREKQLQCLRDGLGDASLCVDFDELWSSKRNGASNVSALKKLGVSDEVITTANAFWAAHIESDACLDIDRVLPGALEALTEFSRLGPLHLISARKNADRLVSQIELLKLSPYFASVTVVSDPAVAAGKAQAFRKLKIDLYVGDTEADWEASQLAGITPYIVSTGQRSELFLRKCGVADVYSNLNVVAEKLNALQRK